jgi:membrane protease subunit HflK
MTFRELNEGGPQGPGFEFPIDLRKYLRWVVLGLVVVGIIAIGMGSFFQVEPEEEALVLRFGKPTRDVYPPGLHFKIPFVDQVVVLPVQRQHRLEFGFRSEPGKVTTVQDEGYDQESLMLTGDLQLVHVRWSVIYRIDDIQKWLFVVKNQEETIRDVAMAIMRELVGDYSLHELLTTKVNELQVEAMRLTGVSLSQKVPTGVSITELSIRDTDVPRGAKEAFDEFNRAEPGVREQLAKAKAALHSVTGDAEGEMKRAIGTAEKGLAEVVKNAEGEAEAFLAKLREFRAAPEITRQWMYLQTMTGFLARADSKLVLDAAGTGDTLKLLPLTDLLKVPGTEGGGR